MKEENTEEKNNQETNNEKIKNPETENNRDKNLEGNQENSEKTKSRAKKILNITGKIIVWAIILLLIAILIRALVFKKYDVFGYRFYLIGSGSMEPTINVGDAVVVKESDNINAGDIVAFEEGDMIIVHRITKVYTEGEKKLYQTKGDNNNIEDGGLRQNSDILGKLEYRVANAGNALTFLKDHMLILIVIIAIIIIVILIKGLIL